MQNVFIIASVLVIFTCKVDADQKYNYPMSIEEMKNLTPEQSPVTKNTPQKKYKATHKTKQIRKRRKINKTLPAAGKKKGEF